MRYFSFSIHVHSTSPNPGSTLKTIFPLSHSSPIIACTPPPLLPPHRPKTHSSPTPLLPSLPPSLLPSPFTNPPSLLCPETLHQPFFIFNRRLPQCRCSHRQPKKSSSSPLNPLLQGTTASPINPYKTNLPSLPNTCKFCVNTTHPHSTAPKSPLPHPSLPRRHQRRKG